VSYHWGHSDGKITGGGPHRLQRFAENILQVMPVCGAA